MSVLLKKKKTFLLSVSRFFDIMAIIPRTQSFPGQSKTEDYWPLFEFKEPIRTRN